MFAIFHRRSLATWRLLSVCWLLLNSGGVRAQNEYDEDDEDDLAPGIEVDAELEDEPDAEEFLDNEPEVEEDLETVLMDRSRNHDGELCKRRCRAGRRRICHFTFVLEFYQCMGAACGRCALGNATDCEHPQCVLGDGYERGIMSINRQVPGPTLNVCLGDLLVIDVVNKATGTSASIHWHGMHQRKTQHMDGVPHVTQCPILDNTMFRYSFRATQAGTQFYHSHSGYQKTEGQYGAMIVGVPRRAQLWTYDSDLAHHTLVVADWMHQSVGQVIMGLPSTALRPESLTINGRGSYIDPVTMVRQNRVSPYRLYMRPNRRYRIRLINAGSMTCPFQVQLEGHTLRVISVDSFDVVPRDFDTLVINAGERIDFVPVLQSNNGYGNGDFWLRVRAVGSCLAAPIESLALVRYRQYGATLAQNAARPLPPQPAYSNSYPALNVFNNPLSGCNPGDQCINEMHALMPQQVLQSSQVTYRAFLSFNNYAMSREQIFNTQYQKFINVGSSTLLVGAVNNVTMNWTPYSMLTQPEEMINDPNICTGLERPARCNGQQLCSCVHMLKVPLNAIMEMIVVDETRNIGPIPHPFHLHGYAFQVVGMGTRNPLGQPMTVALARSMADSNTLLPRSYSSFANPPLKDTVSIPSRGYVVLRFNASNPGIWLMHCHYEWHLSAGMGFLIQVGEPKDWLKRPHNFPTCNNYMP